MAIILGIDPSISSTGLSVIDTSTFQIIYQGTIKNPSGAGDDYKLDPYEQIRGGVRAVLQEYKVEKVYIEKMFVGLNGAVVELLFCAAFMARLTCHDAGVPWAVIPVGGAGKGWRWFTLGAAYSTYKGSQAKLATKSRLTGDLGQKIGNEHQADATGIALAGWYFDTGVDFRDVLGVDKPDFTKETRSASSRKPRKAAASRS